MNIAEEVFNSIVSSLILILEDNKGGARRGLTEAH